MGIGEVKSTTTARPATAPQRIDPCAESEHHSASRPRRLAGGHVPRVSPWLFGWFTRYAEKYVRRHFHAVRVLSTARPPTLPARPVVVYVNHPAWWDPLIGLVLLRRYFVAREHYAPIEAAALRKYAFFERIGFFGVEAGTARGASEFLRTSLAILDRPQAMLWITAQGEFVDVRTRPVVLRSGLGHLAARLPDAVLLPLALEYPFWNERLPEALAAFGRPLFTAEGPRTPQQWSAELARRLEQAQDALAAAATKRRPETFETLLSGRAGVGGVYDTWRRAQAWLRGERFHAEHGARLANPADARGAKVAEPTEHAL